ncbi:hypothetical protein LEP1GSC060_0047 [Leptospira weilii serovar Ranarum str. ICFT]|uniref:Uncharacterized protein n=1 Tax=Leptospira weilii serovar Ranarum str. ICFT TaxID=1218598 RepID=N1WHB1_9LEPT|nr:hypothetical protein LEP1GSC060_0047 [Leptospira weilii serovar Ranarum str. ICFT]
MYTIFNIYQIHNQYRITGKNETYCFVLKPLTFDKKLLKKINGTILEANLRQDAFYSKQLDERENTNDKEHEDSPL